MPMSNEQMARALSGATRECPCLTDKVDWCVGCQATGWHGDESCVRNCRDEREYVLGERARKRCPGYHEYVKDGKPQWSTGEHGDWCCHGDGWLSTLREEREPCDPWSKLPHSTDCKCGGSGVVQAWRLQLLIELLEASRIDVSYGRCLEGVHEGKCWYVDSTHSAHDKVLTVAACEALDIKV